MSFTIPFGWWLAPFAITVGLIAAVRIWGPRMRPQNGPMFPDAGGALMEIVSYMAALLIALLAWLVWALVAPAAAHEATSGFRYDSFCCSDQDCRPADPGEIVAVSGGWHVVPSDTYVAPNDHRIHPSPDGRFHICNIKAGDRTSGFWCLYIPPHGS